MRRDWRDREREKGSDTVVRTMARRERQQQRQGGKDSEDTYILFEHRGEPLGEPRGETRGESDSNKEVGVSDDRRSNDDDAPGGLMLICVCAEKDRSKGYNQS